MRKLILGGALCLLAAAGVGTALDRRSAPVEDNETVSASTVLPRAKPVHAKLAQAKPAFEEIGEASWYGPAFQGKLTASGVPFNMNDLTAAHPTLPLGSHVTVTNLGNGLSVTVEINDRGPFAKHRIIDLSRAAAKRLDMFEDGVARVRIEADAAQLASADRPEKLQ